MKTQAEASSINFWWAAFFTGLVIIFWNFFAFKYPVLILSENQTLYIYSSISQVIAGIYGLTVAGYAFLRNQQDRMMDKDESLVEIFERIQKQQHDSVFLITIISGLSIISSLLAIAVREVEQLSIRTIASNTATCFFITSLVLTAYFVIDSMRPEKIITASESIKNEVSSSSASNNSPPFESNATSENQNDSISNNNGKLSEFLKNYNSIERTLDKYVNEYFYFKDTEILDLTKFQLTSSLESIPLENYNRLNPTRRKNWTKARIVKSLASEGIISSKFAAELLELIRYRNALVHGKEMIVDDNMLTRVINASVKLNSIVSVN